MLGVTLSLLLVAFLPFMSFSFSIDTICLACVAELDLTSDDDTNPFVCRGMTFTACAIVWHEPLSSTVAICRRVASPPRLYTSDTFCRERTAFLRLCVARRQRVSGYFVVPGVREDDLRTSYITTASASTRVYCVLYIY